MVELINNGEDSARVFGPTGVIITLASGEKLEVGYDPASLTVEAGGNVTIKPKETKPAKEANPAKETKPAKEAKQAEGN